MVRELTVQWKAYGALVGSWNMLVYGTAIFVMVKISGDAKVATSKLAFALYFLGLAGLLFGWSHHTYLIPNSPFIRNLGYIISMTELIVLAKIIWDWRRTLSAYTKYRHLFGYHFLFASEIWIFLNLIVALAISVPAVNLITHGTHITVAHAMGTTIGINTMILLASVFYIIEDLAGSRLRAEHALPLRIGFLLTNASLLVFWLALIAAGLGKANYSGASFQEMMTTIRPYLLIFAGSGVGVMLGMWIVVGVGLRLIFLTGYPRGRTVPKSVRAHA
jgi:nitric oxide reductase subunit B